MRAPSTPAATGRAVAARRARSLRWLAAAIVWGGVGWLVLAPAGDVPGPGLPIPIPDKLAHFLAWFVLAVSLWCASSAAPPRRATLVLAATATFAVATEALQALVPGRHPDALDVVANLAGACFGVAASAAFASFRAPRRVT